MSIRLIAIELYRAQQKLHKLQDQYENGAPLEREKIKYELKAAQAECDQLRRLVEAEKEPSPFQPDRFKY